MSECFEHVPAPTPPEAVLATAERVNEINRRQFLGGIAAGVISGVAEAAVPPAFASRLMRFDTEVERALEYQPTNFEVVDASAERLLPGRASLIVPGFNVGDPRPIGAALAPSLRNYGQVLTADFGNQPFDVERFADETVAYAQRSGIRSLNLYGHSLGGLISLALAQRLHEAGIEVPLLFANSTPSDKSDVKGVAGAIASPVTRWLYAHQLSGGYLTRTGVNYAADMRQRFERFLSQAEPLLQRTTSAVRTVSLHAPGSTLGSDMPTALHQLWQTSFAGFDAAADKAWNDATDTTHLSNEVCISQLMFLASTTAEALIPKLSSGTSLVCLRAAYPEKDATVRVAAAEQKMLTACLRAGKAFTAMQDPRMGHADPTAHPDIYNRHIATAAEWAGIPDARFWPN